MREAPINAWTKRWAKEHAQPATAPYIEHLYGLRPKPTDRKRLAKMPNFVKCSRCGTRYNAFIHASCPQCGKPAPKETSQA